MAATFFPLSALFVDVLIIIMFHSKEVVDNKETKLFSILVKVNFIECLLDVIGIAYIRQGGNITIFSYLQKIDMIMIMIWSAIMFVYVFNVSFSVENSKKINTVTSVIIMITSLVAMLLENQPIVTEHTIDATGLCVDFVYGIIIFFAFGIMLSIIISIIKDKNNIKNKKYFPLYALVLLAIVGIILRQHMPELVIEPFIMGYVVLIMYHTIENPDIKMVEKLTQANIQADKANRAKSDFLSSMSHEIRTPLNAIVGFSEDIQKYKEEVNPTVVEDANYILEASQTLLEIVGNILDINKIEADKMELVDVPYNFKEEVRAVCNVNSIRIEDKPINFKISIAEDIPYELIGDKVHVKQIVNNLLTNSMKYTESGEIHLSVKCINNNNICNLIIGVKDTGRGIKKENIDKLFTKFERLDVEKNTTTEGTGLGLAITKKLVDMMGGKINVQSDFGKGSIFVVQIPQKISKMVDPNEKVEEQQEVEEVSLEGKKVLIVDDNLLNIKVARRALESFNFNLDDCDSGQACLDKINGGESYDLILMDIMMPNMSGEDTLEKLKQISGFNTPAIALTADAVAGAKEKYLSEGFIDYIAKPFTKDQISEKLEKVFKK